VWKVPTVSVHWLNDVLLSNVNAVQCMNNPKYHSFRPEDPLRVDYGLVQNLMVAWKTPIRVTPVSEINHLTRQYGILGLRQIKLDKLFHNFRAIKRVIRKISSVFKIT
jgi:hypothetical protein